MDLLLDLYSYPYPPPSANDADNAESIDEQAISHDNSHQAATARANFSLSADIVPQDKPSEHDEDKHSQHNEERLIEEGQHHPDGNAYMGKMKRRLDSSGKEGIGSACVKKWLLSLRCKTATELKLDEGIYHFVMSVTILTQEFRWGPVLKLQNKDYL
jgi:hypothetical protein